MKKVITLILILSFAVFAQTTAQFINLGMGGVSKISDNGTYVCGSNYPLPAFLWSETTGRIDLGPGYTEGYGVSNGGIVVGRFLDSTIINPGGTPTYSAGYYDGTNWIRLNGFAGYPPLDEMSYTHAYGISGDGSIIVGMQWTPNWRAEACYWDISGIHLLGRTGGQSSRANDVAVNMNGFRIAGWDGDSTGPDRRAFYWDPQPHFMGGYDSTYYVGESRGMNSDGSKIVGGSVGVPFVWSETGGMEWITTAYLNQGGEAVDISDNDIIVGYVDPGGFNYQAFIKKPEWSDIIFLKSYLIDSLDITGISDWYFPFLNSISADGLTIGGTAYPPAGGPIAFVVKLPGVVPVELISFTGFYENNEVVIDWSTSSELNNQGFTIERKTEISEWASIGFVPGHNTTTNINTYRFVDNSISTNKYFYRLKQTDFDGTFDYSDIIEIDINVVSEFSLSQNYPNPFNPSTKISFNLAKTSNVKLAIFNTLGEKVAELINEIKTAGNYDIEFNAVDLSSGIYLYRLEAGDFVSTRKMTLLK